jgi:tyrosinase
MYPLRMSIMNYLNMISFNLNLIFYSHPAFLPWHRLFVSAVEKRLQKVNPTITIPYWDWSHDWSSPLKSPIFSQELGLDVQVGPRGDCRYRRHFPRPHCLIRNYNPRNFTAFYPSETIDAVVRSARDFDQIRQRIEWVPHGIVHAAVGGPNGDMTAMHSPNDPMFWLHHANVDRLWWNWQQTGNRTRHKENIFPLTDYRGRTSDGVRVTSADTLNPFKLTVNQTFASQALCYSYAPFSMWNSSANKSRTTRPSRGFFLPDPIPGSWIRMHGMKLVNVRKAESLLAQLMAVQHQQQTSTNTVEVDENDQIVSNPID